MDPTPIVNSLLLSGGSGALLLIIALLIKAVAALWVRLNQILDKYSEQATALALSLNNLSTVIDKLSDDVRGGRQ